MHQNNDMTIKKYTDDYDKGYTKLFGGDFISKASVLVEAYGVVDELNSIIGVVRAHINNKEIDSMLHRLQKDLFNLSSDLASPTESDNQCITRIKESDIKWLEDEIERMDNMLPELKNFIFPTGSKGSSLLHLARAIARKAERRAVALRGEKGVNQLILKYLNRVSDFLFYMARYLNMKEGIDEIIWSKDDNSS